MYLLKIFSLFSDYPDKCYYRGPIEPGQEVVDNDRCEIARCTDKLELQLQFCQYIHVIDMSKCKLVPKTMGNSYPDCCVKFECKNDDGTTSIVQ